MAGRIIEFDYRARARLMRGIDLVADTVAVTLGPSGRHVLVEQPFAHPLISRNGYRLAREIDLPDRIENMGSRVLREVAWRTSDECGDGTTTAMVLTRAMAREGLKLVAAGLDPNALQRAIAQSVETVLDVLAAGSRTVDGEQDIRTVAALAAGDDLAIGNAVARAFAHIGRHGVILIEDTQGTEDAIEIHDGMRWKGGWISSHFATGEDGMRAELDEPYILLHLAPIKDLRAIVPALEAFAKSGKALLVIAEDVTGEALSALVVNKLKAGFNIAAVKAPGFGRWRGPMMEDIAVATGGQVIGGDLGSRLEDLRPAMLGKAKRAIITAGSTMLIDAAGDQVRIASRVGQLRHEIEREKHLSFDREQLQERLARLVSGVAVARFGGATESAIKERKERSQAAVSAARAALSGGVVPGGGAALLHAGRELGGGDQACIETRAAIRLVRHALAKPMEVIANNRGRDGKRLTAELTELADRSLGYDAGTDEVVAVGEAGILDPGIVVCAALRNAASTASRLITTMAAVAPIEGAEIA